EVTSPSSEAVLREVADRMAPPVSAARDALARLRADGAAPATIENLDRGLSALEQLSTSLLDAAALSEGTVVLERERADVGALLRSMVETHAAEGRGEVTLSLPEDPVILSVDRRRAARMVEMLLRAVGSDGAGPI